MVRRSLRRSAVTALAVGFFLSGTAVARAGQIARADQVALPAPCTTPPPPNLPPGKPDPALLWPQRKLALSQAGGWYLSEGKGVTVAVLDTGVDPANPVFAPDAVLAGPSLVGRDATADHDCDGHGTAVAAIVAGSESGLLGFTGTAPQAQILPIQVTSSAATPTTPATLATAIRTATAAGARVITVAMGVPDDSPALRSAVQSAVARDVLIVAAVGTGPETFPAALPGVLAVGAIDSEGRALSGQADGALVSAPGALMAVPAVGVKDGLTSTAGPGLAAAYVSGVAALALAYRPHLHNWQVVQRLEATADEPVTGRPAAVPLHAPRPGTGYGLVDPFNAVEKDLPDESRPDPSAGPGEVVSPADAAVPGRDGSAARLAFGLSAGGVLALAAPVVLTALRRGRVKGSRAGV